MFNDLLKMYVPMSGILGDEDNGGSDDTPKDPPIEPPVDNEGTPPTPPAENEDDKPEISDDEFANLKEVLSPEQFESIQQTRAMNKRMREKMAKLEKERQTPPAPKPPEPKAEQMPGEKKEFNAIAWVSDTDKGKAAIAHLQRSGLDNDQITAIIDLMGITGTRLSKWAVDPIASEFREGKFMKALDAFSSDDKYKFVMSKPEIRKEVESFIRNNNQPDDWNKPETIKAAYGTTIADHPEIFTSGKREIVEDGSIHEKSTGSDTGTNSSVLAAFAKKYGMDFDTKENKQIVKDAYTAYLAVEKKKEK